LTRRLPASPPTSRVPRSDRVDVWRIDLRQGDADLAERLAVLSADERSRASRFVSESARVAFITARSAMRTILSEYLRQPPASLRLALGRHGKPYLADCENLHFNLSHSGELAALAISERRRLGVDIERFRPVSMDVVADSLSPAELCRMQAAPDSIASFYAHWTMKEAYLKALGEGLHVPLAAVSATPGTPQRIGGFVVTAFDFRDGFSAAIAIESDVREMIPRISVREWSWPRALHATVT
jgi:4'-phosphopantetheinyl transferase